LGAVVSVTANVTGGNILTGGLISATGTVTGGNIIIGVTGSYFDTSGVLIGGTNAGGTTVPNATTIAGNPVRISGTNYNSVADSGTIAQATQSWMGKFNIASAQAPVTYTNLSTLFVTIPTVGTNVTATNSWAVYANGSIGTTAAMSATANVTGGNILTGGLVSSTGTITGSSHLGAVVSVTANVTASNVIINGTAAAGSAVLIVSGNIQVTGTNATANIGSVTTYFNTIHGKSTTAQYADLAELYIADAVYLPGTVLDFGGANEVTLSSVASSARVAGVVSTDPAYLMNGMIQADTAVALALMGRAPASVTGTVRKGDMMVSAGNGVAQACATPAMGTVIGKSLEDFDGDAGMIEIVIGRL